jgi:hypothetical protein
LLKIARNKKGIIVSSKYKPSEFISESAWHFHKIYAPGLKPIFVILRQPLTDRLYRHDRKTQSLDYSVSKSYSSNWGRLKNLDGI